MEYKIFNIHFEPIKLKTLQKYDDTKYNSNNHQIDIVKPNDYFTEIDKLNTINWIHKINRQHCPIKIINEECDLQFLSKLSFLGKNSGELSPIYYNEIITFVKKYEENTMIF